MTITTLPTPPTRSDPTNFASRADAFLAALPTFGDEANALAAAMNLNATNDTSTTSNSIGTGAKTFTVSTGKSYVGGMYVMIADTAAPTTNAMIAQVTSYSGSTLVVNVKYIIGSGTKTAWIISQSVPYAEHIDGVPIGATTPAAGTFSVITGPHNGTVGATTPSTGVFTTVTASGDLTATNTLTITDTATTYANTDNFILLKNSAAAVVGGLTHPAVTTLGLWGNTGVKVFNGSSGASTIADFTSSGLAVTGAVSATGTISNAVAGSAYLTAENTSTSTKVTIGATGGSGNAIYSQTSAGAASPLNVIIGATTAVTIDNNFNVGLSVTPSAWSTGKAIEVGTVGTGLFATPQIPYITSNAYYNGGWKYGISSQASNYSQSAGQHIWNTAAAGTAGTAITFTQSLAVGKGTSLALEGATSAAGTGIAFPATQLASSDANTLDDYREGTWTPTLTCGTSGTITLTTPTNSLSYVKVGKMVYVNGSITVSSVSSPVGDLRIDGLPFTVFNSTTGDSAVSVYGASILNTSVHTQIQAIASKNTTSIYIRGYNNGSLVATFSNNIQAGSILYISAQYPIS